MEKNTTWLITAKTNLHVGDESIANYGIVDNKIQRDTLTGLPCINSSSLKGAIKEYCCSQTGIDVLDIFGSDKSDSKKSQKGRFTFFDAQILFLPVQSDEKNEFFYWVTTKSILKRFRNFMQIMKHNCELDEEELIKSIVEKTRQNFDNGLKTRVEIIDDDQFREFCDELNLPIIARNVLNDGQSQNLWYEQVLPPETVLYTLISGENTNFQNALENNIVQIGANASIGYGYCQLNKLY